MSLQELRVEIKKKQNKLWYIQHRDLIIARSKVYNQAHQNILTAKKLIKYHGDPVFRGKELIRVREAQIRSRILRGLCHKCFHSNVDIEILKGMNLCKECAENDS